MTTLAKPRLYDEDVYAWTQAQTEGLRQLAMARPNLPLDLDQILGDDEPRIDT